MTASTSAAVPRPLSIVHVLAPGLAGGLESVVATLATGQARVGHAVRVISVLEDGQQEPGLHSRLTDGGVETVPLVLPSRAYSRERSAYRDHLSRIGPDLVHTHGYRSDVLAGGIAGQLKLPRVTTVHGFTGGDWKNRIYEYLQVRAFKRFDAVVAVSESLAGKLQGRGVPRDRLAVIPNAFDLAAQPLARAAARQLLGLAPDGTIVGWVGRLSREKGLDVLLDALALLGDVPLTVSVLGSGRELRSLEDQAARLGLAGRIRWHGLVPEAGRLYRAFDVFALSSRTEGTPISLFEAMAAQVPVVATAVGGVPQVLRETEGRLVPSESPAALAAGLREILADGEDARARAGRALNRLQEVYAVKPWLDRYERLYRSIILTRLQ